MELYQALHQAQANAKSALRLVQRALGLGKQVKNMGQKVGGNANAGVAYAQRYGIAL